MKIRTKKDRRERIRLRQRKRIHGTAERPRLAVFRRVAHIYAQVIDDHGGPHGRVGGSTEPALEDECSSARCAAATSPGAEAIGQVIAERLKEKGITRVVFDRGGNPLSRPRSARWRTRRAKPGWSSRRECSMSREKIDAAGLELKDTVVSISRVTKVVKGGKNLSFSALVVVGDGHGVVGFGIGKAKEVPSAIKKAIEAAKKALDPRADGRDDDSASGARAGSAPGRCC